MDANTQKPTYRDILNANRGRTAEVYLRKLLQNNSPQPSMYQETAPRENNTGHNTLESTAPTMKNDSSAMKGMDPLGALEKIYSRYLS